MSDFTKPQAKRWVVQEAGKHDTAASINDRIATELKTLEDPIMKSMSAEYPNSTQAHRNLITVLQEKLKSL